MSRVRKPELEPRSSVGQSALVSSLFIALTLVVTYPGIVHFGTHLWGFGDLWQHMWNFWWYDKALTELHRSPYFTEYMYYPTGASLASQSFSEFNLLLGIPLRKLFGAIVTYNLLVLLSYVGSGVGTYLLVRHITGSVAGGLAGGVLFAFSAFRVSHLMFFHIQSTEWIPFFAWSSLRLWESPGVRRALLTGVFLALSALCTWYFLLFLILFSTLFLLYQGVADRQKLTRAKFVLSTALSQAVAFLLVAPFLLPLAREHLAGSGYLRVEMAGSFSADLLSFVVPPEQHPLLHRWVAPLYSHLNTDFRERVNYLGLLGLGLGVYGTWVADREGKRRSRFWWLVVFVFCLLAMGPYLQVAGSIYSRFSLPFGYLADLPGFSVMRAPTRFTVMATLGVAVLGGMGTAALVRALPRGRARTAVSAFLVGALLLDVWAWRGWPMSRSGPIPVFYQHMAKLSGDFAILEIPLPSIVNPLPLYFQTLHEKPLVGGYISRPPESAEALIRGNPFLALASAPDRVLAEALTSEEAEGAYALLASHRIEWIVVHLTTETALLLMRWLRNLYGRPLYAEHGFVAFKVDRSVPKERFLEQPQVSRASLPPASVYACEIFGLTGYKVKLPPGEYRVRLRFAEIFFFKPRERVFDVSIEGRRVLEGFDIVREAGPFQPLDKEFDVHVADGILDVEFTPILNLAKLSGLDVLKNGSMVFTATARDDLHPWDGQFGHTGPAGFYRSRIPVAAP